MSIRHALSALALAALFCAGAASSASAAPSATVPDGETLYGISCNWASNEHGLQVLAIDGDTGAGVAIGDSGSPVYWCALAASWDRIAESCTVYTMARGGDERPALLRTDFTTGESTVVAPLTINGAVEWIGSFTIDGSGAAWATWNDSVYSVNLTTGVLTFVSALDVGGLGYLTWSSADDSFYAAGGSTIYRVIPSTGHATAVGSVSLTGGEQVSVEGMAIDSAGSSWFSRLEPGNYEAPADWIRQLVSASSTLSGAEVEGRFRNPEGEVPVIALVALPQQAGCEFELPTLSLPDPSEPAAAPAALAATGAGDPTPVIALGLATVLVGGALIAAASLRSRRR